MNNVPNSKRQFQKNHPASKFLKFHYLLVFFMGMFMSCNTTDNSKKGFSDLGDDKKFQDAHEKPKGVGEYAFQGNMMKFSTDDGKEANGYLLKSKTPSDKYLFVIHEWWGLNDHIKKETDRYANELPGVNVLALDLYDGRVATKPEDAGALMKSTATDRAESIIRGALKFSGKSAKVATVGWCFGGGWSHKASILAADNGVGCVIYYGMPELDAKKIAPLKADVLGLFAAKEQWIGPKVVTQFEQVMKAVGKKLTVHSFDADHAFANPSSERYHSESATKANALSLAFLKEKLGN